MLTIENLMAALPLEDDGRPSNVDVFPGLSGWAASRHWAARWTEWPAGAAVDRQQGTDREVTLAGHIDNWTNGPRVEVTEDPSLAMPFVPGTPDTHDGICRTCNGDAEHSCPCGDTHDCVDCYGDGYENLRRGIADVCGQSVWRGTDGVETAIQFRYAPLLRGYRVVRCGTESASPLLGIDEAGAVVVAVMPLNEITRPAPAPSPSEPTP